MKSNAALALTRASTRDVLLTASEVGDWLKCSPRQVARLGIACVRLGVRKLTRYRERDVQAWLEQQPATHGRARLPARGRR